MKVDRKLGMDEPEALERLKALADYWVAKYGVSVSWAGSSGEFSGKVMGVKFSGTMKVQGGRLTADIKAGFLAKKLGAGKYVEGKLDDYLNPAHSVAELRARIP